MAIRKNETSDRPGHPERDDAPDGQTNVRRFPVVVPDTPGFHGENGNEGNEKDNVDEGEEEF